MFFTILSATLIPPQAQQGDFDPSLFQNFVGGGAAAALLAQHSALLLAVPDPASQNRGNLGGGSIVTRNRVLTTATLVDEARLVRAWFYDGDMAVVANQRRANSIWIQPMSGYDPETRLNDIAVVVFRADIFPVLNVIPVRQAAAPETGAASFAGWGFVAGDSTQASRQPLLAAHTLQTCAADFGQSASHLCALAVSPAVVCSGDVGNGLWLPVEGTPPTKSLVGGRFFLFSFSRICVTKECVLFFMFQIGVLSRLSNTDCSTAAVSSFTSLSDATIQQFLASQQITPV